MGERLTAASTDETATARALAAGAGRAPGGDGVPGRCGTAPATDRAGGAGLRVSVIVPAYNEQRYLPACLDALARHVAPHVAEIIVVDNNSTDATRDVVAACGIARYAFEPEKGITRARQRGLVAAGGDLLAFVDADTRPPAGWIERLVALFAADPGLACASGPYSFYDLGGVRGAVASGWFGAARLAGWLGGSPVVGGNFAIRRDVLVAMGGFNRAIEFWGEDVDIARRARRHGRVVFAPALVMPTSARRLRRQGLARTAGTCAANYLAVMACGRPLTRRYQDVR